MTYKVFLRFKPQLPQWWRNLLKEISDEYGSPYQEVIEIKLKKYNAYLDSGDGSVNFRSKKDYTLLLLRYS